MTHSKWEVSESVEGYLIENGNSNLYRKSCDTPPKAKIPVLSFHGSLFEKEICMYIPSANSLKSLHNFLKRAFVPSAGPFGAVRV